MSFHGRDAARATPIGEPGPRIKILYVIDDLNHLHGGTEGHLHTLIRRLDPARFECSVVAFHLGEPAEKQLLAEGVDHRLLRLGKIWTPNAMRQAVALRRFIREKRFDLVQTFHFKSDTFGALVARLSGVRHIVSSRRDTGDIKSALHYRVNRLCNPLIDRFITVCDRVGQAMSRTEGLGPDRWTTIYNGVDLERFASPDAAATARAKQSHGFEPDDFVVGMVAYFRPEKAHDIFLEAMRRVAAEVPRLRLLLVGRGPRSDWSKQFCAEHGLKDKAVFTGQIKDVRGAIAAMDVACLVPGSNEGLSNSVLQKMAMGRPLVVTDIGGNAEMVLSGENGIVIPPRDVERLTESLLELWRDPELRQRMGRAGRLRVERCFTLDDMIRHHEQFYVDVMRNGRNTTRAAFSGAARGRNA